MKIATMIAASACALLPVSAEAADGPLAWQLIGTNPDVYAPALAQPPGRDYFHRRASEATFLHPKIGMSFAALRIADQCGRDDQASGGLSPKVAVMSPMCPR